MTISKAHDVMELFKRRFGTIAALDDNLRNAVIDDFFTLFSTMDRYEDLKYKYRWARRNETKHDLVVEMSLLRSFAQACAHSIDQYTLNDEGSE